MRVPITIVLSILLVLLIQQPCKASRVLYEDGEKMVVKNKGDMLILESLQRAPVPPSGSSGCTNIPGGGGPSCLAAQEMNFAGDAANFHRASAYPHLVVPLGIARNQR
ncbi:hypothetical protein RHSIM_Rhsim04G0189300 [Rhododendron simsii]|uniref:Uncharacterized protein n=1 Tax=Rhododendron simsii TaxID=118357 RepID=A0A834HD29_RHOSS|nr:hypothetical protein RHSIM_Rhsim04G0189300 [Rhododendron simsii]